MLDINKPVYLKKNVKVILGYRNAAFYNFNDKNLYLTAKATGEYICRPSANLHDMISPSLLALMEKHGLITFDVMSAEANPFSFDYDLFDDCHSGDCCKLLYIEVTDVCNFNCIHCYAEIERTGRKFLSVSQLNTIIDHLPPNKPCDIRITGGEPFLNKAIRKLVDVVYNRVPSLEKHSIVTNGSFALDDAIYALDKGFELQVSVYGMTYETFRKFTNTGMVAYKHAMDNLIQLSQTPWRDNVLLCFAVNSLTYEEIEDFKSFCLQHGFRFILNRPASIGRAVKNWNQLELPDNIHYEFARATKKGRTRYCYHLCQLHITVATVDGDIVPCTFLRDKKFFLGNIISQELQAIWNSEKYRDFRALTASKVDKCASCEFMYACTAGCCGEAVGENGNILATYPWCKVKPFNSDYLRIENHELFVAEKLAAGTFDFLKLSE